MPRVAVAKDAPKPVRKRYKRAGAITQPEKQLVAQLVQEHPGELTSTQVNALATAMRRSRDVVKELVEQARENFVSQTGRYVEIHKAAVEAALANGDAKSLGVAAEGAQWFLEKVSEQGVRVIEKEAKADTGQRIMIGIRIGAVDQPVDVVDVPATIVSSP